MTMAMMAIMMRMMMMMLMMMMVMMMVLVAMPTRVVVISGVCRKLASSMYPVARYCRSATLAYLHPVTRIGAMLAGLRQCLSVPGDPT